MNASGRVPFPSSLRQLATADHGVAVDIGYMTQFFIGHGGGNSRKKQ